ncbi:MAG: hypothetical protein QG657_3199 [Acidobacteriota bacterium]|nr:hypothetical protein [Acidobacteriota bacterium]
MRKRLIIVLSILLLNTLVFAEYQDQEEYQAQYYDNARVLRVKYAQGETYVQRSYDEGFEEATVNLSIFEKDKVGTTAGRVEIYLGRLNFLRLDYDTEVEFERAPELRKTDMTLRVRKGGIYLDIRSLDNERDVEVQTPDCGVFLLNRGLYRINVTEGGESEVLVYEGLAEVSGYDYSRNVRENQKIIMRDGRVTERPFYFYAANTDEFDRWNHTRNRSNGYARYGVSRYLSNGYEDYEYELSRSGRWVYNNSCREYTWIPYNIGSSWRPYYHGRWHWNPFYGYVWNSYDSWGYFTHHYGRWEWDHYYGWYWIPGYRWSPAWVYWFWDNDYYGWCPVSRWNRPVIIINNHWNRHHDYHRHGIPAHSRSTVIIKKHQLGAAHIDRVALNKSTLRETAIKAHGFGPKERPSNETIRVINARGNTVLYKKSGFQETQNYQTVKPGQALAKTAKESEFMYKDSGSKATENNAFKYSKGSTSEKTLLPRTFGREGRENPIEKKDAPEGASSGFSYKSDTAKKAEKSNEAASTVSERTFGREGRETRIEKKDAPEGASSGFSSKSDTAKKDEKYGEKSSSGSDDREKSRSVDTPKTQFKPSEPKETKKTTSGTLGGNSSSGTAQKAKEKEKEKERDKEKGSSGFSPSERYSPSSKPSASDNSSSYRSSSSSRNNSYNSYKSYKDTASKSRNAGSSSETYVPSYRSRYSSTSEKSSSPGTSTPRERLSYSSYGSSASSASSSSSTSSTSSTPRYSSPSRSYSSYSQSSSSHSSYSAPTSSRSSYSGSHSGSSSHSSKSGSSSSHSSSSHSSRSASSSSGSHSSGSGTAVKKHN